VKKILSRLVILYISALFASAAFGEGAGVSADLPPAPPLFRDSDKISVFVAVSCEDELALETAIRVVASDRLHSMNNVEVAGSIEEASVLLSFEAFRLRKEGELRDMIVYSFAYGTPDTEYINDEPVSLPRYLYHQAVVARGDELAARIYENIKTADENFIRLIR
jgi:hypothetical protein